jgi:mRNA deadenylase 3'-5' endonuclease subunit Ccr4
MISSWEWVIPILAEGRAPSWPLKWSVRFSVATWNILATAYIRREYYPQTSRELLDPACRVPALALRAAQLDVDVLCLQEVERDAFAAIAEGLTAAGYEGRYARKGHNRPDGCATFVRTGSFALRAERRIVYADGNGGGDSGHVGQLLTLENDGRHIAVLNTHLKWDPPDTPRAEQWGYRQIQLALAALEQTGVDARIVCGDFNVTPESDVVSALLEAGMDYAHRACAGIATCNANRKARLIDYLFHSVALRATPVLPPPIDDDTVLPAANEPSDHLPLIAGFELVK